MPLSNLCSIAGTLANDYIAAVSYVNKKFNALRRLAELLEQIGDLSIFLPDISGLIPVVEINLDAYLSLVQACPFLNLPKVPVQADIDGLRSLVQSAYLRMIANLNVHPFNRMGKLQAQLDKAQDKFNEIIGQGNDYLQCVSAICSLGLVFPQSEFDKFKRGYVASGGKVLTPAMQAKVTAVQERITRLNQLIHPNLIPAPAPSLPVPQADIPVDHPIPRPPELPII